MTNCPQSFSPTPFAPFHRGGLAFSLSSLSYLAFLYIARLCGVPKVLPLRRRLTAQALLEDFGTSNPFWKEADTN